MTIKVNKDIDILSDVDMLYLETFLTEYKEEIRKLCDYPKYWCHADRNPNFCYVIFHYRSCYSRPFADPDFRIKYSPDRNVIEIQDTSGKTVVSIVVDFIHGWNNTVYHAISKILLNILEVKRI